MMNRISSVKCISILLLWFTFTTHYCHAKVTVEVVSELMPPLQFAKPGEKMYGYSADLVNAVIKDTQYDSTNNVYPWARSYLLASTKPNVVIYPIVRTKQREKDFHWIGKIWNVSGAVYRLNTRKDINVSSLEDAKNYNISVYRNDFFHRYLLKEGFSSDRLFPAADIEQSIKLFVNGRVDLIVIDSSIFEYYLKQYQKNIADYIKLTEVDKVQNNDVYMALSKLSSKDVVDKFIKSFNQVSNTEKFSEIRRYWMAQKTVNVRPN